MVYEVRQPILGFDDLTEVQIEKHDGVTTVLKSTCDDNLRISLINASIDEKSFEIPLGIKTLLDITESTNYSVYFTVILDEDINNSTINLGSPLIFNEDNKTMAQSIISDDFTTINAFN